VQIDNSIKKNILNLRNMSNLTPSSNQNPSTTNSLTGMGNKIVQQAQGTYSAEIRRDQPTAIVFLIDQSGSMGGGELIDSNVTVSKAEAVARIVNRSLEELISRSTKAYGTGNYFDIALIGYGQNGREANFILPNKSISQPWDTLTDLAGSAQSKAQKAIKKGRGGTEIEQEIDVKWWIDPVAGYRTPMGNALEKSLSILKDWILNNSKNYPPIVINITDGVATDANEDRLVSLAEEIKNLKTTDGQVLLFNCHLEEYEGDSFTFPTTKEDLPSDNYAHTLFQMSSIIPHKLQGEVATMKGTQTAPFRAMAFKAGASELIKMMDIGTRTAQNQVIHP
jgi:hypothetical protein